MIEHVSILGTRVLRTEDPRFLTTGGVYTADLDDERLAGACQVHFVRATVAHARILSVDVSAALAAPGVIAVFTGADIDLPVRSAPRDQPEDGPAALARDVVRFVGEPVAAVVTEGRYQGEDAAELVDVDYDPLPVVVDMTEAAEPDAALLFPEAGSNVAMTFGDAAAMKPDLFDGCEAVVSQTILNQRVAPAPMETRAAAAVWGADGRVTAWIPNQGAQGTRGALAGMLGIDQEHVHIITPDVGGAFGAKFGADPEHAVVCWVARAARPARALGREPEREPGRDDARPGAGPEGHDRRPPGRDGPAYRLEILQDSGAYTHFGVFLPSLTILMAPGPYNIPNAEAVATSVVTNTTPVGAYRGAGRPEATAAIERAMDLFAAEIGADPAEVRAKNLLPPFTEPHTTAFGATVRHRRLRGRAGQGAGGGGLREPAGRAGQAAGRRGRGPDGHRPVLLRGDHRAGRRRGRPAGERHGRGASRRQRHHLDRHVPARSGARDGVGHAGQRRARHPDGQDHGEVGRHRPDSRGRRHRRLAQPAAGRRGGAAGLPRAHRRGPGPRRRGAGSQPGRPGLRPGQQRVRGGRGPGRHGPAGQAGRAGTAVRPDASSGPPVPPSRSARTWPWWTWTPRPARWCCGGW